MPNHHLLRVPREETDPYVHRAAGGFMALETNGGPQAHALAAEITAYQVTAGGPLLCSVC